MQVWGSVTPWNSCGCICVFMGAFPLRIEWKHWKRSPNIFSESLKVNNSKWWNIPASQSPCTGSLSKDVEKIVVPFCSYDRNDQLSRRQLDGHHRLSRGKEISDHDFMNITGGIHDHHLWNKLSIWGLKAVMLKVTRPFQVISRLKGRPQLILGSMGGEIQFSEARI